MKNHENKIVFAITKLIYAMCESKLNNWMKKKEWRDENFV